MTGRLAPTPQPHQVDALTDLTRAFAIHDRAQLVMACGTGKTLVGRWHAEASETDVTLVLVPSLALLAQTIAEWRRGGRWHFDALVVCSDPTTAAGADERRTDDGEVADVDHQVWEQTRAKVTTDHHVAMRFLRGTGRRVVFSTYHSAPVVAHAQAATGIAFDLAICDEAHRLTGRPRDAFRVALDRRRILARRRLFMTATPAVHTANPDDDFDEPPVSMDDHKIFGPVAHHVSFRSAIDAGLLCDYQVLVVAGHLDHEQSEASVTIPAAVLDAVDRHGATRLLTFHGRVAKAAAFADLIDGTVTPGGRRICSRHVSGLMPTVDRAKTLRWLGDRDDSEIRLVANARCLGEGVDVPVVDAVMFADQRTNVVDIVQAVGRVLRPAPGKHRGLVIVPVALPPDADDDTNLTVSAFGHVWSVLRGLRAHDERLADDLDTARREYARTGRITRRAASRIDFVLPDGVDVPAVELRLVEKVGASWERYYGLLQDHAEQTGGKRIVWGLKWRGVGVGMWAEDQRVAYRRGLLPASRARRLEQIPGWAWDRDEARWQDTYKILQSVATARGTLDETGTTESIYEGIRSTDRQARLGTWLARQRQAYRDGTLDLGKAELLERLPGFTWTPIPADDIAMVEALRIFVDFEKHADVPEAHDEDGLPLGRWVYAVRRRKITGRLHPALSDELLAAAPWVGQRRMWKWNEPETQWRLNYSALRQFAAREGHAHVPNRHMEQLPDTTVNLYHWTTRQRFLHRKGELEEKYAAWLEALPGWQWDYGLARVQTGDPIDLDGHAHGTAKGSAARCPCLPCLEYSRKFGRQSIARHRAIIDPVPAEASETHLRRLQDDISQRVAGDKRYERPPGANAFAAAAGVPVGAVRAILLGRRSEVARAHETAILALTPDAVLAMFDTVGSRGRLVMSIEQRVDAEPTAKLVEDLVDRGFNLRWIARELGYHQLAVKFDPDGVVVRRLADQVAALHARVGARVAPKIGRTERMASLAELEAADSDDIEQVAV